MDKLFKSFKIGSLNLPNRVIRAALYEPFCPGGILSDEFINVQKEFINGGVGTVTTGFVAVHPEGRVSDFQLDLTKNSVEDLQLLTQEIHELGGSICCQLGYVPFEAFSSSIPPEFEPLTSSSDELEVFVERFAEAAVKSKEAGFDGVELHHYFITRFLYPESNQREDEYGGSLENRARLPSEVISKVRAAVGEEYPVFVKMTLNPTMEVDEVAAIGEIFQDSGASAIVTFQTEGVDDFGELYALEKAKVLKDSIEIPVVYSCGVETLEDLETVFDEGFEVVQIGRSLLRDPQLCNKIRTGEDIDECVKCNGCHRMIWNDIPDLMCVLN